MDALVRRVMDPAAAPFTGDAVRPSRPLGFFTVHGAVAICEWATEAMRELSSEQRACLRPLDEFACEAGVQFAYTQCSIAGVLFALMQTLVSHGAASHAVEIEHAQFQSAGTRSTRNFSATRRRIEGPDAFVAVECFAFAAVSSLRAHLLGRHAFVAAIKSSLVAAHDDSAGVRVASEWLLLHHAHDAPLAQLEENIYCVALAPTVPPGMRPWVADNLLRQSNVPADNIVSYLFPNYADVVLRCAQQVAESLRRGAPSIGELHTRVCDMIPAGLLRSLPHLPVVIGVATALGTFAVFIDAVYGQSETYTRYPIRMHAGPSRDHSSTETSARGRASTRAAFPSEPDVADVYTLIDANGQPSTTVRAVETSDRVYGASDILVPDTRDASVLRSEIAASAEFREATERRRVPRPCFASQGAAYSHFLKYILAWWNDATRLRALQESGELAHALRAALPVIVFPDAACNVAIVCSQTRGYEQLDLRPYATGFERGVCVLRAWARAVRERAPAEQLSFDARCREGAAARAYVTPISHDQCVMSLLGE